MMLSRFFMVLVVSVLSTVSAMTIQRRDDNLPARVPYVFPPPGTDPIADALRSRRTNGTLLDLDGVLLDAPLIAEGWNDLFSVIRDNNTLPGNVRELFILRVGTLNNAAYVWLQHESVARSEGLTTAQLLEIRNTPPFLTGLGFNQSSVLSPVQNAAMAYADWITNSVHVPDLVFNNLKKFLNNQQLVEATATAGGYNFVSRFVVALNVDDKMGVAVPIPK